MKDGRCKTLPVAGPSNDEPDQSSFQPDISGEHRSQRRYYFGSQKIGLHRAEQGQGCFKSKRKRPRKQANPRSTYPFFYDVCGNDHHWMKSSVVQDAKMGWWVIPKQPRSKNNRPMMKATKKKHQQPEKSETTEKFKNCITNQLNGSELMLVIKKKLFKTDVERNNNKFSMPIRQVRNENFLTAEEIQILDKGGHFEVALFGPDLHEYKDQMVLKRWNMNGSYHYVLRKNWNDFTVANGLKEGTNVEAWSFRRGNKLCFALAVIKTS